MLSVNILASENALFSTIFGPSDMFMQAGIFWNLIQNEPIKPYFDVAITGVTGDEICGLNGAKIKPHRKISASDQFDLVIVPSEGMNIQPDSESFQTRVAYIKSMHDKGAIIASICTGAFLLGASGLLDGKTATTHWAMEQQFRLYFPKVLLDTNLLIAEEGKVLTAGGVSADQDLSMHLIEKCCSKEVALQTARCTLVDRHDRNQRCFKSFVINKTHGDQDILQCQKYISENLHKPLMSTELTDWVHLTPRTLSRRFRAATNYSVNDYVQGLKIEKARQILEMESTSFDQIANQLGYENVSFFRRIFKKQLGVSPKEYRKLFCGITPN